VAATGVLLTAGAALTAGAELVAPAPDAARVRSALPEIAFLPEVDKAFLRANDASRAVCAIIISVLSGPGCEFYTDSSHPLTDAGDLY
jgi:hypothetical protein